MLVKLDHHPQGSGWKYQTHFKTPPRFFKIPMGCIHHPSCFFCTTFAATPPKKVTLQKILRECPPKRPPRDFQDSKCTHRLCPFATQKSPRFRSGSCPDFHKTKVLMVQKSGEKTDMTCMKPVVNHGRNYQSQLAIDGIFPSVNISAKNIWFPEQGKTGLNYQQSPSDMAVSRLTVEFTQNELTKSISPPSNKWFE